MAKDHGPSVKDDKQYEGLRKKGMSKERAAKIATTPNASEKGGSAATGRVEPEQQERRLGQRRQPRAEAGRGPQRRTEEQLARRLGRPPPGVVAELDRRQQSGPSMRLRRSRPSMCTGPPGDCARFATHGTHGRRAARGRP
jgi:hypothetical protein